ncbi:hypothetical protein OROMI_033799 [Orobanche minor]
MDPVSDPPLLPDQPTADVPVTATAVAAANPTPAQAPAHSHPPYAEMITAAVSALNERNGSSKRAVAKYIEAHYSNLPSTHSALLTHHLKRLKTNGQLLMVKHSYMLPRSAHIPTPVNGAVNAVYSDTSAGAKRRPGRPPKLKPDSIQVAVPVFEPPINMNAVPVTAELQPNLATGLVNGTAASLGPPVRGRGRPPKHGLKRGPGRPPKSGGPSSGVGFGRVRVRPKIAGPTQVTKGLGRPRGRPHKPIHAVEGLAQGASAPARRLSAHGAVGVGTPAVVAPVAGKRRRGRPPKAGGEAKRLRSTMAGQPTKPRNLSGKPLGRPKKLLLNASAEKVSRTPDSQLLVAYLDLKAKLQNLQSRISQTANLIKPHLNNEAAINALQELELIAIDVTTPPVAQYYQQPQPQPQPQPPPPPEQYPQQTPQS